MTNSMTRMNVPFLDLKAQYAAIRAEVQVAVNRVIENTSFILGHEVQAFEARFAEYCETDYAVGVDSGTSAIEMILRAYGIGPGDEVITAANTFIATVLPITYVGAKPVLLEMDQRTYQMDVTLLESAITSQTKAIIPVHLYGQPVDMDPVLEVARKHNLLVIEDACQAHGARYRGKRTGGLGDAAAFSFYPGKNLGAYGDGGMITTRDSGIDSKLRKMRDYGQSKKYHHDELGYNRRLDAVQAAILNVKLNYLDRWNGLRRQHASLYTELLSGTEVVCPAVLPAAEPVWHLYVIQVENRDGMQEHLQSHGISTGIHYPIPIHLQKAYADMGYGLGSFPQTEAAAGRLISLPMYAELTDDMIQYVSAAVKSFT